MLKKLIELTFLAILVVGLVYLVQQVGPIGGDAKAILKYLGLGVIGLAALGIISVTILGLTAIVMGISFAKGASGWGRRHKEHHGASVADLVGGAIKGAVDAAGGATEAGSTPRRVTIELEKYPYDSFSIKTLSGDLKLTGGEGAGAKAELELLERTEGDAEAFFEDGEIKVRTRSGKKCLIGDAAISLPARLARLNAESVNGDVEISGFVTGSPSSFKGVNGDITISGFKNSSEVGVKTVSGDVLVKESQFSSLLAQSISGDVTVSDSAAESAVIKTVSGDIDCAGSDLKNPTLKTVSGEVTR